MPLQAYHFCSLKHRISELARAFGKTRCKLSCDEHIVINPKKDDLRINRFSRLNQSFRHCRYCIIVLSPKRKCEAFESFLDSFFVSTLSFISFDLFEISRAFPVWKPPWCFPRSMGNSSTASCNPEFRKPSDDAEIADVFPS